MRQQLLPGRRLDVSVRRGRTHRVVASGVVLEHRQGGRRHLLGLSAWGLRRDDGVDTATDSSTRQTMVKVFYSSEYVGSAHAFDTTRKAKWVADSLASAPIRGRTGVAAVAHLRAARRGARPGVRRRRPDWRAAGPGRVAGLQLGRGVVADGGSRQTVAPLPPDSRRSGLVWPAHCPVACTTRRRDRGAGFCTFNGLALAARAALAAGAASVLILDLDAHCGGGTASLIAEEPRIWQLDVSVCAFDSYESRERASLRIVAGR